MTQTPSRALQHICLTNIGVAGCDREPGALPSSSSCASTGDSTLLAFCSFPGPAGPHFYSSAHLLPRPDLFTQDLTYWSGQRAGAPAFTFARFGTKPGRIANAFDSAHFTKRHEA
jgi:hypothetical protein